MSEPESEDRQLVRAYLKAANEHSEARERAASAKIMEEGAKARQEIAEHVLHKLVGDNIPRRVFLFDSRVVTVLHVASKDGIRRAPDIIIEDGE